MSDEKPTKIELSGQDIAYIAVQILENAKSGTKLLSVTNNYPRGENAIIFGFNFMLGCIGAVCFSLAIGKVASWIF